MFAGRCVPRPAPRVPGGGGGVGRCPVQVGRDDPQDPLRVPAGRDDEEKQGGARALLPEDLPSVVGPPGPREGGDRFGLAQPRSACVAGGRAGQKVGSLGKALHMTAYGGVGLALSYTGLVWRGRVGASSAPSTNTVISPTSRSSSGRCRRWSAASNSDTPPGYVARAWFRYGAVSPGQRVLRACSRAGALLWRDMADPVPVSR